MLVVSGLLLLVVFLWFKYQWTNRRFIKAASSLPTIFRTYPVIGNAYFMFRGLEAFTNEGFELLYNTRCYKGITTISAWIGPIPFIVILDRKDIQKALTSSKSSEKSDEYKQYFDCAFGNGLITAPGDIWKVKRRFANRLFDQNNLVAMMSTFNRNSRQLVLELSTHVDNGPFNIFSPIVGYSIINITHLLFGSDFEFKSHTEIRRLEKALERATDMMVKHVLCFWLRFKPLLHFFHGQDLKEIDTVFNNLISQSAKMKEINENIVKNSETSGRYSYNDVITDQNKEYPELGSDYSIKSDLVTFYVTGVDTVTVTVASCTLAVAKHSEIQNRLLEEVESVMGERDEVTVEDLLKMEYLEQVYQETLRWSIPVPFIMRKATEDLELAGSSFTLTLGALSYDPAEFPDPKAFNPEHFSAKRRANRDPKGFLPFSGGPRQCIGKRYAEFLSKIMIIHIIRNYKVTTEMNIDSLKKKLSVVLFSSEGYFVSLTKRVRDTV